MSFVSEIINNTFDEPIIFNEIETDENQTFDNKSDITEGDEEMQNCKNCNNMVHSTNISNPNFCSYTCYKEFINSNEYLEYLEHLQALDELDKKRVINEDYDYCKSVDELLNCKNCNKLSPYIYCCDECNNEDYCDKDSIS